MIYTPDPNKVNSYPTKPEYVPKRLFDYAIAAKRQYNYSWDLLIADIASKNECTKEQAERAFLLGLKNELTSIENEYGEECRKWFQTYIDVIPEE